MATRWTHHWDVTIKASILLAAAMVAMSTSVAAASGYTFKTIADNQTGLVFADFFGQRMLNNGGEVAFQAFEGSVGTRIYKGSGGPLTTIAGPPNFNGLNSNSGNGAIDDAGIVVFTGSEQPTITGIFVGSGGAATTVASSQHNPSTSEPERSFHATSVNGAGDIAFRGERHDFPDLPPETSSDGFYVVSGSTISTLAEVGAIYSSASLYAPVLNDSGQAAFIMSAVADNTFHVLRYDSGVITTIKTGFLGGHQISMNNLGAVAFADFTKVQVFHNGVTTTVASAGNGFSGLMKIGDADVAINDIGDVAFWGDLGQFGGDRGDGDGIYVGPDIVNDRVLVFGDVVLGHLVENVDLLGLNNAGQLLMMVEAKSPDTWRALVVATPFVEADFDEDGDVDVNDLALWKQGFGTSVGANHGQGDADGDHDVDGSDFLVWQRQRVGGAAVALGTAVPEPSGTMLVALAIVMVAVVGGRINTRSYDCLLGGDYSAGRC